ncbi:uncharacterized protein [Miscanthus floridulus]|uniref:uncharacterized protein n=1 Tax=Miscanthus floridulus TaxID=154761 RepID=UPI00345824CB
MPTTAVPPEAASAKSRLFLDQSVGQVAGARIAPGGSPSGSASSSTATLAAATSAPATTTVTLLEAKKPSLFRFEKWWLEQPDFKQLVAKIWSTSCAFDNAIDIWQFKVRLLRKKLKGWARNINADIKRKKVELLKEFDILDKKYESRLLLTWEKQKMGAIVCDLEKIWSLEEMKARQRSRYRNVKEGDRNTAYFQAISNQRARKKRIPALESPDDILEDTKDMLSHAEDKVTTSENELLEASFTEDEIKAAIFDSYAEGAPGPDGFSFLFYQAF